MNKTKLGTVGSVAVVAAFIFSAMPVLADELTASVQTTVSGKTTSTTTSHEIKKKIQKNEKLMQ